MGSKEASCNEVLTSFSLYPLQACVACRLYSLRIGTTEFLRRRTLDRANLRRVAHIEFDFAAKLQGALDHGVRADHDMRATVAVGVPAAGLVHQNTAVHAPVRAHGDIAIDGLDAAGDVRLVQRNGAVDVGRSAEDFGALAQFDGAVGRFDHARDPGASAHGNAAVDGIELVGGGAIVQFDFAVDRAALFDRCARGDIHPAV